jgi:toxin ParE1/3/4
VYVLSGAADLDLSEIYIHTIRLWDRDQAEDYLQFLKARMEALADDPALGDLVAGRPEIRTYLAKFSRRRSSHGHRIIYRQIAGGIRIIRILHTSMDWKRHVP